MDVHAVELRCKVTPGTAGSQELIARSEEKDGLPAGGIQHVRVRLPVDRPSRQKTGDLRRCEEGAALLPQGLVDVRLASQITRQEELPVRRQQPATRRWAAKPRPPARR